MRLSDAGKKRLAYFLSALCFSSVFVINVIGSTSRGPWVMSLPAWLKTIHWQFSPQGWAFFTKDSKEFLYYVYRQTNDGKLVQIKADPLSLSTRFGLNRLYRRQMDEANQIGSKIGESVWTRCHGVESECVPPGVVMAPKIELDNPLNYPDFCGDLIIRKYERAPLEWRTLESLPEDWILAPVKVLCGRESGGTQ